MTIDQFSKHLIERSVSSLSEKYGEKCPKCGKSPCECEKKEEVKESEETIAEKVKMDGKDDNGFDSCWKGYKKKGTKIKGGKEVNDCVKAGYEMDGDEELAERKDMPGNQEKIDANKNGKVDAHDFALLRAKKGKKSVKEMWEKAVEVAEGKKVEIEIMPEVDTPNDPEPVTGKKAKKEVKKEEFEHLEEKKLSAKEKAKKEKFVKGMKKKFGKMKSKYGEKAQSVMFGAATNMAKKAA